MLFKEANYMQWVDSGNAFYNQYPITIVQVKTCFIVLKGILNSINYPIGLRTIRYIGSKYFYHHSC